MPARCNGIRAVARAGTLLFVPALEGLYSDFDARIGHHRRYSKASLRRAVAAAELVPEALHYVNSVGALAWFTVARLLRAEPTKRGPALLYDRAAVPVLGKRYAARGLTRRATTRPRVPEACGGPALEHPLHSESGPPAGRRVIDETKSIEGLASMEGVPRT